MNLESHRKPSRTWLCGSHKNSGLACQALRLANIGRRKQEITWKYPPPSKRNLGKATIDFGDALYALANASRSSTHDSTKWHLFRKVHKAHARPNHPNHSHKHVSVNVRQTLKVIVAITLHILHTSKQIILTKQTRNSNLSNWKL